METDERRKGIYVADVKQNALLGAASSESVWRAVPHTAALPGSLRRHPSDIHKFAASV